MTEQTPEHGYKQLQRDLLDLFERYGLSVGVGLGRECVVIRSQDPRVDASNIGTVHGEEVPRDLDGEPLLDADGRPAKQGEGRA